MFKHALVYAALVGGPCLGLVWVLHLGASLTAAPRVGGAWALSRPACLGHEELRIEQSGRYLRLETPGAWAHVEPDGRLRARFELRSGPCAGPTANLTARPDSDRRRLDGTVRVEGCGACDGSVPLVAERLLD